MLFALLWRIFPAFANWSPNKKSVWFIFWIEVILWPYSWQVLEKFNLSTVTDRQRETGQCPLSFPVLLNIAMSCCNLAMKLQHFRQTRNERRAVINRTNPNFDSWLQIFSCLFLLSNISLDALIVPWMRRFTFHNLWKSFTAIFSPVFHSMVLFSPYTCVYSRSSRRLSRRITYVITKHYMIGLQVHQWF